MARIQSIAKPTPKPDRTEATFSFLGDHLERTADTLQGLSDLLYHNQDKFENDPLIVGVQNILQAIADDLAETAGKLKGGAA
ncbi:MAG: hypothetical protein QUT30_01450 [Acidobacteriota bacterium]|nr:hypothetical protein [Acidobacteriota bacterium]